jgi:hypothetical protein
MARVRRGWRGVRFQWSGFDESRFICFAFGAGDLVRFPLGWNHPRDKKSRKFKKLEQVLIAKVYQLLRNLL